MPLVTAAEAGAQASQMQRAFNSSRYIPEMDPMVREASEAHRVYLFNVGPWSHKREMGSAGRVFIQACPEGQEYSDPYVVNGIESEPYPINETECAMLPKSGRPGQLRGDGSGLLFAQQILGEGPMVPKSASFRPFGVFISKTPKPSAEDLATARMALRERQTALVAEANEAWSQGRDIARIVIQPNWHHRAARDLGKTPIECPWLGDALMPAERKKCLSCGTPYDVGIAECAKCGDVLDADKYAEKLERLERAKGIGKKKVRE